MRAPFGAASHFLEVLEVWAFGIRTSGLGCSHTSKSAPASGPACEQWFWDPLSSEYGTIERIKANPKNQTSQPKAYPALGSEEPRRLNLKPQNPHPKP